MKRNGQDGKMTVHMKEHLLFPVMFLAHLTEWKHYMCESKNDVHVVTAVPFFVV